MKLSLKSEVYDNALLDGKIASMSEVKWRSGLNSCKPELNYATVLRLCKGKFGTVTLNILARYFTALGMTTSEVRESQVKDLFDVED